MKFIKRSDGVSVAARSAAQMLAMSTATLAVTQVFAQSPVLPNSAGAAGRIDVPDGVPTLAADKGVDGRSAASISREAADDSVNEERIQGRLATARVSVGGGRTYSVVDPSAGRFDRQADNAGRRVTPALWELFRF